MRTGERLMAALPFAFGRGVDGAEAGGGQVCTAGPGWRWWDSIGRKQGRRRGSEAKTLQDVYTGEGGGGAAGDRGPVCRGGQEGEHCACKDADDSGWPGQGGDACGEEAAGKERGGEADRKDDAGAEGVRLRMTG